MKSKVKVDIDKYCKTAGTILIILGIVHIILSGFLSAIWGYLIIILGIFALSYRKKVIMLIIGIGLIVIGVSNITNSIFSGIDFLWLFFGGLQVYLGISEINRYKRIK